MRLLIQLAMGALAGYLASRIMNVRTNWVRNVLLGVAGSFVGGWLAALLGIYTSAFSLGGILISVSGACLLIWAFRKL